MIIISKLSKIAGFYSTFFFMMNHYIYCKKNNINFKLDSSNWLYKYNNGWSDYFEDISLHNYDDNNDDTIKNIDFGNILYNYPIIEYKNVLWDIYKYNKQTIEYIKNTKQKLGLENIEYGSIFIRRGDKLIYESKIYQTERYVDILLEKYPKCKIIFLQTDDYNCYIDIENYIKSQGLDIKILTLCEKSERGILLDNQKNIYTIIDKNIEYINNIKNKLLLTKPVIEMSSKEIYDHTIKMLIGLDIVFQSKYCILDYQSNISRFIKLAHKYPENVFDIEGFELDLNAEICPAYSESVYIDFNIWRHL